MNLRQKVKIAKKKLAIAEEKYSGTSTSDIINRFKIIKPLEKTINYKKKPSRFFRWNEPQEVDWAKLTYIKLQVNSDVILRMVSPNGRPFTNQQLLEFMNDSRRKMYQYGVKISKKSSLKNEYVDYVLIVSDDKTKQKRFLIEKLFCQYYGEDKMYHY